MAGSEAPTLSIATVYRALKKLSEEESICPVALAGEPVRYEAAGQGHHHHFQCRQCQRVFDVHACPGDLSRLAPRGFTVEDHDLTLYGRCEDCVTPAAQAARTARHKPGAPHAHSHAPRKRG